MKWPETEDPPPLPDPVKVYCDGGRQVRVYAAGFAEGYDWQLTGFDLAQRCKRKRRTHQPLTQDEGFYDHA